MGIIFPSVIICLFPSGRVGRAGRSGIAYSLVCPDEMPFVYDLHLFLGRPVQFATHEHTQGRLHRMPARTSTYKWTLGLISWHNLWLSAVNSLWSKPLFQIQRVCLVGYLRVSWMTKVLIWRRFTRTPWTCKICTMSPRTPTSSILSLDQTPHLSPSDGSKTQICPACLSIHY